MTPEWEDIEPWQDERMAYIATGYMRLVPRQRDLDKFHAAVEEYLKDNMQDSSSQD
jgi:hypothetical protein